MDLETLFERFICKCYIFICYFRIDLIWDVTVSQPDWEE